MGRKMVPEKKKRDGQTEPQVTEQPLTFEEAFFAAEQIVNELEDGSLTLGESLRQYEHGIRHLATCFQLLEEAELRINQLTGFDAEGRPQTVEFESEQTSDLEQKARSRSRRRSATPRSESKPKKPAEKPTPGSSQPDANLPDGESVDESGSLF